MPLVLFTIFYAAPWFWLEIGLLISLLAVEEYWRIIPATTPILRVSFLGSMFLALILCALGFELWLKTGLVVWALIVIALLTFPASQRLWGRPVVVAAINVLFWPLFLISMARIYALPQGQALIVYLLLLVWTADSAAYLIGKLSGGRHKLIPEVSPGKSWEGFLAGMLFGLLLAALAYTYFKPASFAHWLLIAMLTLLATVVGDLCISMFKRYCHLKDTGDLIPGHGGVLDRLDSLIAAAPIFYAALQFYL